MYRLFWVCLFLLFISGCASNTPFLADKTLNASNTATLIIYTPDTAFNQQNFIKPNIYIDGKKWGKVSIQQPLITPLSAGLHKVSFQRSFFFMPIYESGNIDINVTPLETYYIRYSYDFDDHTPLDNTPSATGASSFRLIDRSTGENRQ